MSLQDKGKNNNARENMNRATNGNAVVTKSGNDKLTCIYLRLSSDDGNADSDSNSIQHQRAMCVKYASDNGFTNITEFVDDGYSGIDFDNRPAFQQMLTLIESGQVGTVVCKDLSRLGREYIQMGMFLELHFPRYGVRFIAIQDNIDSQKGENDFTALRSLFNEWHVRDTSRKVRAVKEMMAKQGKRVNGSASPYGYRYDEETERLVPDSETAPMVRRIFDLCMNGHGPEQIARILTEENIVTPTQRNQYAHRPATHPSKGWSHGTVAKILERQEYIGHTVFNKTHILSYKQKKRIENDESDYIIHYNTHEPLVDEHTFEIVQKIRQSKKRHTKMGDQPMFSGLVYCADCGSPHYFTRSGKMKADQFSYNCSSYRHDSKSCTAHGIRLTVLSEIVLAHIRAITSSIAKDETAEKEFAQSLLNKSQTNRKSDIAKKRRELDKAHARIADLDKLFNKLFEQLTAGNLTEERFRKMSQDYEREQAELKVFADTAEQELTETTDTAANIDKFVKKARKYLNLQELTPVILRELVDKIVVHEKVRNGKDGKYGRVISQQIDIHYNFVGLVDGDAE